MLSVLNNSDARREGEYIGEKRGETKNKVNNIKSFVKKLHLPIEQIMDILDIPIEEQRLYYKLVNDPVFYEKYFADKSNFVDPSDDEDEDFEENDYEE